MVKEFLIKLLSARVSKEAMSWIENALTLAGNPDEELMTYQSFARVPSMTGKAKLVLSQEELDEASAIRKGWNPSEMTIDQAARILLLLSLPSENESGYKQRLQKFFDVADMYELETLCLGLPLYPFPKAHIEMALQGLRSNIKAVFEAIALNNPYPAENFELANWNQMVLKALFVGSPVYKIYGVDERANANLASMLSDYAHERWAAGRTVSPELWRCTVPFMNAIIFNDILRVLTLNEEIQQEAGVLTLFMSNYPEAKPLLEDYPELKTKIIHKEIHWQAIGKRWHDSLETVQ